MNNGATRPHGDVLVNSQDATVGYALDLVSHRSAPAELPRADGRRFVVTGGAAGMGYFTSERLAGLGAHITIAARNPERAERAIAVIRTQYPEARLDHVRVDLADLASIREGAARIVDAGAVDGVVANAGVLPWDRATQTADGLEPAYGTNQLGHFALLARLFPALTPEAGIVQLGSLSHLGLRLRHRDLDGRERRGTRFATYGRSKLAVMTTAVELDRRLRAAGSGIRSVIAHPGYASGVLDPAREGIAPEPGNPLFRYAVGRFANSKQAGAEVNVTALLVGRGGEIWGPDGWFFHLGGEPARDRLRGPVTDPLAGAAVWAASERATGVEWIVSPPR